MKKKITIAVATIVLIIIIILLGSSFYMINYSLSKGEYIPRDSITIVLRRDNPQIASWLDSIQENKILKDIYRTDSLGGKQHALYLESSDSVANTAVLVHGYHCEALSMLKIAYIYHHDLNYNVLLPDLHAHGQTDGEYVQMGWFDRIDVESWIGKAVKMFSDSTNIIVHGISMGAATTMMVSGDKLPNNVRCFVEDCGYTSVYDEFKGELSNQFGLPEFPLMPLTSALSKVINGWSFSDASAIEQVKKCSLPMLFIHGDSDTFVPSYMVHEVYDAKPAPKELWVTKGVPHDKSFETYPEEYTEKIMSFCSKYMR